MPLDNDSGDSIADKRSAGCSVSAHASSFKVD